MICSTFMGQSGWGIQRSEFLSLLSVAVCESMGEIIFIRCLWKFWRWEDGTVDQMLATHVWELEITFPTLTLKPGVEPRTCDPSPQEAETRRHQELTEQPSHMHGWTLHSVRLSTNQAKTRRDRHLRTLTSEFHMCSWVPSNAHINICVTYIDTNPKIWNDTEWTWWKTIESQRAFYLC